MRIFFLYLDKNVGYWFLGLIWRGCFGCLDRGFLRGNFCGRVCFGFEGMMLFMGNCWRIFFCCRVKLWFMGFCWKRVVVVFFWKMFLLVDVDWFMIVLVVMVLIWGVVFKKFVGVFFGIWLYIFVFKYKSVILKSEGFEFKIFYNKFNVIK